MHDTSDDILEALGVAEEPPEEKTIVKPPVEYVPETVKHREEVSTLVSPQEVLESRLSSIISEFDGEGNIPLKHIYWRLLNNYKMLVRRPI